MNNDDLLKIKAKAFDMLMEVMDGKHHFMHSFERWVDMPRMSFDEITNNATIRSEKVDVYEWRVQMRNRTDLKQAVMDAAAAVLKRDEK